MDVKREKKKGVSCVIVAAFFCSIQAGSSRLAVSAAHNHHMDAQQPGSRGRGGGGGHEEFKGDGDDWHLSHTNSEQRRLRRQQKCPCVGLGVTRCLLVERKKRLKIS